MALKFPIYTPSRYAGRTEPVKRPKEFACFSYDKDRNFHLGDSSLKWYYTPQLDTHLSNGFDKFVKHDDSIDEHLDGLLKTIANHEQQTGKPIDAHVVTWRGMMTKIMASPFDDEEFEMNATLYRDCIFIEEHHEFAEQKRRLEAQRPRPAHWVSLEEMQFWGYKFETLSTIPRPWGEVSREDIENRDQEIVNNKEQYCSVVRTGFGNTIVCLGGEVDAIWDSKPETPGAPINWVELKTSTEIRTHNDQLMFDRKLMKYWIQSFLLGVPRIIVGFRTRDGILTRLEEYETMAIPYEVQCRGLAKWDGNVCIKFTQLFLDWLRVNINDDGVWRIRRQRGASHIELFRVEEAGHGSIITDEFMNWRIKLELSKAKPPDLPPESAHEPTPEPEPEPAAAASSG
ncbi:ea58651c-63cb-4e9a-b861-5e966caefd4e [Thermothielavioides terrestris]|uniref:Decapping nuclease n=1 Tax=Thermothielavioides terrestris TaxID=2587410 RepID=A0A446BEZ3_9PEZI|nr:ea58651c-63cb-4e9a-b861-5e966caefd4e [Thermothielavioides terrestris]